MGDLLTFLLCAPLVVWAFYRVFVWPFTKGLDSRAEKPADRIVRRASDKRRKRNEPHCHS